jgi:hypothetical protein
MLQRNAKQKALDVSLGFGYISDNDKGPEPKYRDLRTITNSALYLAQPNYTHLESPHPPNPYF